MGQTPFRNPPSLPFVESVDEGSLKAIAESTGGIFRMAEDGESLKSIYQEIDRLERSAVQVTRFANYRELFPPLALAALLLVSAETVLNCTLFRRIP
jgi:Ca-activated chloride channel family protein